MTTLIDIVDESAQQGHDGLRYKLAMQNHRQNENQLVQNINQCLAESLDIATNQSEEGDRRIAREIKQLMNDHDKTYFQTMINLNSRLEA